MSLIYNKEKAENAYKYYLKVGKDLQNVMEKYKISEQGAKQLIRWGAIYKEKLTKLYVDKDMSAEEIYKLYNDPNIFKNKEAVSQYTYRLKIKKPERYGKDRNAMSEEVVNEIYDYYKNNGLDSTVSNFSYPDTKIIKALRSKVAPKELLHELYYEQDMSRRDILKVINDYTLFQNEKILKGHLNRNHITRRDPGKSSHKHVKETAKVLYGYDNFNQMPEVKAKTKKTNLERYGFDYAVNTKSSRDKVRETKLAKVDWVKTKETIVNSKLEAVDILKNPKVLSEHINKLRELLGLDAITRNDLAKSLGVSLDYINNYIYDDENGVHTHFKLEDFGGMTRTLRGQEDEVADFLDSLGVQYVRDSRPDFMRPNKGDKPLELDFYLEEYGVAIEFNGSHWHSEKYHERNYHEMKTQLAREQGVRLLHIFSYDWENPVKQDIIKSQLSYMVHKGIKKYNARSLTINEVSTKDTNYFMEVNHIQGSGTNGEFRYGLYDGDTLVSVMVIGKKRFSHKEDAVYELQRFANLKYTSVRGGASRLFKAITKDHPEIHYIESFANNDFAHSEKGSVYNVLGFTYDSTAVSRYNWVKNKTVVPRHAVQTKKLRAYTEGTGKEPFKGATKDFRYGVDTEDTYMSRNGYYKVWHAGNDKYIKHL